MAEIQFIVDKLNEPPFNKDLRLVRTGFRDGRVRVTLLVAFMIAVNR